MILNIGKDFSDDPSGRFRTDGDSSGEAFREDFLKPMIEKLEPEEKLTVILDEDVDGYGSSFLVEGFAGMVKYGYIRPEHMLRVLQFEYKDEEFYFYEKKIRQYISEAKFASREYEPTKE